MTGEFPSQRASNAEIISIWWVFMRNMKKFFNAPYRHQTTMILIRQATKEEIYTRDYHFYLKNGKQVVSYLEVI